MKLMLRASADPSVRWIVEERAEVGRMKEVDIPLHDPSISKLHAVIERIERRYVVADLGSKNGSRLNGVRIEGATELAPGDRIEFGNIELLVDSIEGVVEPQGGGTTSLLLRLCQSLLLAPDLDEVLRVALDQFINLTRADRAAILLLEGAQLRCKLGRKQSRQGTFDDLPPAEFGFTETLARSVVQEGRTRIVYNAIEDELLSHAKSVVHLGVTGAVCVPLQAPRWGGGVKKFGVLYGDSVRTIVSSIPLDLLESIGGLIALAIESSRTQQSLRDHSELLEEKVRERTAELRLKHRQLLESEKMAATGLLAAGIAHELGNALLQVSANVELIREFTERLDEGLAGSADPEVRAAVSDLKEASALCLVGAEMSERTVRDLKSFARLDEAEVKLVSLNEALEIVARLVEKGVGRSLRFEVDLQPLPLLWCYPERMNQVFLNLLVNAVQASEPGRRIRITARQEKDAFHYVFEDEGCGIPPEILGRIFEPFFTTKKVGEGSGLGLSLAYQTVSEHGGRIEVQSTAGQGSRFSVVLPLSLRERPPEVTHGAARYRAAAARG